MGQLREWSARCILRVTSNLRFRLSCLGRGVSVDSPQLRFPSLRSLHALVRLYLTNSGPKNLKSVTNLYGRNYLCAMSRVSVSNCWSFHQYCSVFTWGAAVTTNLQAPSFPLQVIFRLWPHSEIDSRLIAIAPRVSDHRRSLCSAVLVLQLVLCRRRVVSERWAGGIRIRVRV